MDYLRAVFLALVQGITEFLPISSEAHLILVPILLGWPDQGLLFDVATNTGTLTAVMVYFRQELAEILRGAWHSLRSRKLDDGGRLAVALIIGTVPITLAGLAFYDTIVHSFRSLWVIGTASIVFGLLLWWVDRRPSRPGPSELSGAASELFAGLRWSHALAIGAAQALALIPGTSRSGITITVALLLGLTRPAAARFSLLLAIPVGLLAAAHEGLGLLRGGSEVVVPWGPLIVAYAVAGLSAFVVIRSLLIWLRRQSFVPFVIYRLLLGLFLLFAASRF